MPDSEQERFWAGTFGDSYIERNRSERLFAGKVALWSRMLRNAPGIASATEFGANIGINLLAIRSLLPGVSLAGIEINAKAQAELARIPGMQATLGSFLDQAVAPADLAFTCTVLIHIAPELLPRAYDRLYAASNRYIIVAEYYNPTPAEVTYRGHQGKLFKRDFAGELMQAHPDLRLLDYGFAYHGDPTWPLDDITWFVMEKR